MSALGARSVLVVAAMVTSARLAAAQAAPTARLHYAAQDPKTECPDEAAFRALVTARLGRDPFTPDAADAVSVDVSPTANQLGGRVVVRRSSGTSTRHVHERFGECEVLVEALASIAALAIDPEGAARPRPLPALPPVTPATPPSQLLGVSLPPASDAPTLSPPTSPPPKSPMRFAARGALVASTGLLPATSMGGEIGVGFGGPHFAIFALGRGELQPSTTSAPRLDASLLAAGIAPCTAVDWFTACLVVWAGVLSGRAPDAIVPSLGSSTVGYLGPRVGAMIPLGKGFGFAPHIDALFPLVRTTLLFGGQPAWVAPALAGTVGVGIVYGR